MLQLDLFGNRISGPAALPPESRAVPVALPEEPTRALGQPDPRQADLFEDRWLRAASAQRALDQFELDSALEALHGVLQRYPDDAALRARASEISEISAAFRRAKRTLLSDAQALASLAAVVPEFLQRAWHRRLAAEMEAEAGLGAVFGKSPAGLHWLLAGNAVSAETSLRATLSRNGANARARGYLADALHAQGRIALSRSEYRDALAAQPSEVDFARILDVEVKDLPAVAELDYEVPGDTQEWSAAVGIIVRVFAPPVAAASLVPPDPRAPAGLQFYAWLVREMQTAVDAERIACRRAMKALAPLTLKRYLERR